MRYAIVLVFLLSIMVGRSIAQDIEGTVAFRCDIGTYLSVCTGCQQVVGQNSNTFNTATLHATNTNDWYSRFTVRKLSNGNYSIQNQRGQYLALCSGCIVRGTTQDFATFHATNPEQEPWAQFRITRLPNGKYGIQCVHSGNYLTRCNGCSPTSTQVNQVTVHVSNTDGSFAQWEIINLDSGIEGKVSIKCDIGTYLSVCTGCQQVVGQNSNSFNTATLHARNSNDWFARFTIRKLTNGNYSIQNERGQYLALCSGCIVRGSTQDFATFHATNPEQEPWAQFQIQKLSNGKYSIKCVHNGNYLARCNGCSPTSTQVNQVAVHAGNADAAFAQWEIKVLN